MPPVWRLWPSDDDGDANDDDDGGDDGDDNIIGTEEGNSLAGLTSPISLIHQFLLPPIKDDITCFKGNTTKPFSASLIKGGVQTSTTISKKS